MEETKMANFNSNVYEPFIRLNVPADHYTAVMNDNKRLNADNIVLNQNMQVLSQNNNTLAAEVERRNGAIIQQNTTIAGMGDKIDQLRGTIYSMKMAKEASSRVFYYSPDNDFMAMCEEPNGKKKYVGCIKIFPQCYIVSEKDGEKIDSIALEYKTSENSCYFTMIPKKDISQKKLLPYFENFHYQGSKEVANDFLSSKLREFLDFDGMDNLYYPQHPGFYSNDGEHYNFRCLSQPVPNYLKQYTSVEINSKFLPQVQTNVIPKTIFNSLEKYLAKKEITFLFMISLAGMLCKCIGDYLPFPVLVVSPSDSASGEFAALILKTYSRTVPAMSFTSSKPQLNHFLSEQNSETAVLIDNTVSDGVAKQKNSIDVINGYDSNMEKEPFILAIVSQVAGAYFAEGKAINMELPAEFICMESEAGKKQFADMLGVISRYFAENFAEHYEEYKQTLQELIGSFEKRGKGIFTNYRYCNAYAVICAVYELFNIIFHSGADLEFYDYVKKLMLQSQDSENGKNNSVVYSFKKKLNQKIADHTLQFRLINENMAYIDEASDLIYVSGNSLYMNDKLLQEYFVSEIPDVQTVTGLIKELKIQNLVSSTNGNQKPVTVYDEEGCSINKSLYCISMDMTLNSNSRMYVECLENSEYFTDENLHNDSMLPLLVRADGKIAYQELGDDQNQHRFITGISGSGKTVYMTQLISRLAFMNRRVIIFDKESFSRKEMLKSLSEKFIDEHVTFYNVEEKGLPVNLLHVYDSDTKRAKIKMLTSILSVVLKEANPNQIRYINSICELYLECGG